MVESWANPSSSSRPATWVPPCHPPAYCPRAVVSSSGCASRVAERTLTFSACSSLGWKLTGSSIAMNASSCSRWFWITSRAAPMPS